MMSPKPKRTPPVITKPKPLRRAFDQPKLKQQAAPSNRSQRRAEEAKARKKAG
jgi:hypothetical protein